MAETTPITPVDLLDAQHPFGDASLTTRGEVYEPLTPFERGLQSPWRFWFTEIMLFAPLGLFLLQGLLHELGRLEASERINLFLFGSQHTIVGDMLWPVVLPMCALVIALARVRLAKRGWDRTLNVALIWAGALGLGVVFLYALVENFGRLVR
jgi:4-amino-4-deoxy-L-arabinose transferase-like glycosyltransferase